MKELFWRSTAALDLKLGDLDWDSTFGVSALSGFECFILTHLASGSCSVHQGWYYPPKVLSWGVSELMSEENFARKMALKSETWPENVSDSNGHISF